MAAEVTSSVASEKFAQTLLFLLLAGAVAFIGAVFVFVL
jgi:hypothetical protein